MYKKAGRKTCAGEIYSDDLLELSDDDSSKDNPENKFETSVKRDISFISKPDGKAASAPQGLPSAGEMFETVAKPSFLGAGNQKDIDWEKITTDKSQDDKVDCSNTHAIPPPQSYDSQTPALKPTLGNTAVTETRHKRHAEDEDLEDYQSSGTDASKRSRVT